MQTNSIADLLTRIRNGYLARKEKVSASYSKKTESLCRIISREGYVGNIAVRRLSKAKAKIDITLLYKDKKPCITEIKIFSKPGKREYVNKMEIPKILGGMGIAVISTPYGLLTDKEARKKGVGGEMICSIW